MPDQGQRTEQPTQRRLRQAREEGQIASSRDLTQAVQLGLAVAVLSWTAPQLLDSLERCYRGLLREAFRESYSAAQLFAISQETLRGPLALAAYLAAALVASSLLMHLLQTGFAMTPKRLRIDWSRLNPGERLRSLPAQNLRETAKAVVLLPLFAWACWTVMRDNVNAFLHLPSQSFRAAAALVGASLEDLLWKATIALIALGAWDYWRQRSSLNRKLRMTKQEVRQEQKDLEGNPLIKARFRRLQRDLLRRRMISRLPKASVVVTNPTHYAVALEYHLDTMRAPVVVAKGLNYMALRIRRLAREYGIPIVENPPLAQALYKSCPIGGEIPLALYRAVAEILAYIYRLSKKDH